MCDAFRFLFLIRSLWVRPVLVAAYLYIAMHLRYFIDYTSCELSHGSTTLHSLPLLATFSLNQLSKVRSFSILSSSHICRWTLSMCVGSLLMYVGSLMGSCSLVRIPKEGNIKKRKKKTFQSYDCYTSLKIRREILISNTFSLVLTKSETSWSSLCHFYPNQQVLDQVIWSPLGLSPWFSDQVK